MTENTPPRPCPFCGNTELDCGNAEGYAVFCPRCGAEGPQSHQGEDGAYWLWNIRATDVTIMDPKPLP